MARPLPIVLALVIIALVVFFSWQRNDPTIPQDTPPNQEQVEGAGRAGGSVDPAAGSAVATDPERALVTPPPQPTDPYVVHGIVLADPQRLQVDDVRVVAYQGEATDSPAIIMRGLNERGHVPAFVLSGDPIASATVDAAGNFTLRAPERHLRLTIEHDLYMLPTPELVHIAAAETPATAVLVPILGACIKGRLFGERGRDITQVRGIIEPDPMSMMRDMRAFLGAMMNMGRMKVAPDAEGYFAFTGIIPGAPIVLTAEGKNAFAMSTQPALMPGETREVALPVQSAAHLEVAVVDEGGAGIAEARVSVRVIETTGSSMFPQLRNKSGWTDADGTCVIDSLEPTRVQIEAQATGYTAAESTLTLAASIDKQTVRLTLGEGGIVTGTVRDPDGKPLAGAKVAHHPAAEIPLIGDMAEQLGTAHLADVANQGIETDAAGNYRLTGLADDNQFLVVAAHPDYAAGFVKGVEMGAVEVDITLERLGAVSGRVVAAEDGSPLPEFTVKVMKTMFLVIRAPVHSEAIASSDGAFALAGIPPGDYTLEVEASGRSAVRQSLRFDSAGKDVGTIEVPRGAIISGVVQDENGTPVRGALVRRRQGAMADNPVLTMFGGDTVNTRTDAEGRFELGPLPPHRLQLLASAEGFASGRSERMPLEDGQRVEGVVITLGHGGMIIGRLLPGPGNRVDDFMLMAQHQQTQISVAADLDAEGNFRIENLDPGPYIVQAMPNGVFDGMGGDDFKPGQGVNFGEMFQRITESIVSQRCTVRAGEICEVQLDGEDLVVGTRWTLRIDIGGKVVDNGIIEATSNSAGRLRTAMFTEGLAIIGNVEPGAYEIRVRSGMTLAPVGAPIQLEFPAGKTEHTSKISLPGGELRGRVVDSKTSEPLHAALVRIINESAPDQDDPFGMALTNADGEFSFTGLAAGNYGVVASEHLGQHEGAASKRGIRIDPGVPAEVVELRAQPAATASVIVTNSGGAPVAGATVLCVDGDGRPLGSLGIATTDGSGRAWFGGMPRGTARVVGRAPGLAPCATEAREIDPSGPTEFLLTLTTGARTTVHAVDGQGRPLDGATITARLGDGPWLPAMLLVERGGNGTYELGRLTPGAWKFRVNHARTGVIVQPRTIGEEPAVTVVVAPK